MLEPSIRSEVRTSALTRGGLFLIVLVIVSLGARADVSIPDTPAGHTLQAFLNAFNSGEQDRIAAYVKENDPENNADGLSEASGVSPATRLSWPAPSGGTNYPQTSR